MVAPWKKWYDQPRQRIKKQRHYFAKKGLSSQSYGFSSSLMYGYESWTIKKAAAAAAKSLQSCPILCDPIDAAHQAPPSLGFSRQEHRSGLPLPSPMRESEK